MVKRYEPNFAKGGGAHRTEDGQFVRYSDYAELEAEIERLTKELDEAKAGWSGCASVLMDTRSDLAAALSRTGAAKAIDPRHFDTLVEAMAEVKATSDGLSDQPIADIVQGCIDEIAALEPAAPEGQQPVAWGEFYGDKIATVRTDKSRHCTVPLYTRPSEQVVTDAMVDKFIERYELGCSHRYDRNSIRAALKAAMETGR